MGGSRLLLIVLLLVAVGALFYLRKKQGAPGAKPASPKAKKPGLSLSKSKGGAKKAKGGFKLSKGRGRGAQIAPQEVAVAEMAGTMAPEAPATWAQPETATPEWAQPAAEAPPEWAQPAAEAPPEWAQPAAEAPPEWAQPQGQAPAMAQMAPEAPAAEFAQPQEFADPTAALPAPALEEPEVEFDFGSPVEEPAPATPAAEAEEEWSLPESFEWGSASEEPQGADEPDEPVAASEEEDALAGWGSTDDEDEASWSTDAEEPAAAPVAVIEEEPVAWQADEEPEATPAWDDEPADMVPALADDAWSADDTADTWDHEEEHEMATMAVPSGTGTREPRAGANVLDGWMDMPPGGSFAAVLARPVIAQGKFVVAGQAGGRGAPVIGAVALVRPLDDAYWAALTPRDRARHVILDVERTVNCVSDAVEVIADPELAPDADGFVVRVTAKGDGPVMVSGRYSIR